MNSILSNISQISIQLVETLLKNFHDHATQRVGFVKWNKSKKKKKGKIFHPQILSETKRANVRLSGKSYYTRSCRTHLTFSTNKKRYNVRVEGSFCLPQLGFSSQFAMRTAVSLCIQKSDRMLMQFTFLWIFISMR